MQHYVSCDAEQALNVVGGQHADICCSIRWHPCTRTLNDEVYHAGHGEPARSDALMPLEVSEAACTTC
jgi:hypothetical protein